ncbi:hypothetical protein NP493_1247g00082 [Ridgeia piscesae]|uniref:Uncharacterized protein n=1 Tax=Ridgeia piscesae TaxID=27915 RepID=A0AAD9KB51_RIDPI|nr:hypothetical protein NP493_1247g00082 [Ridgeia piscesae]
MVIEPQGTELQGYKDSQEVARLLGELESEKERNRQLEDQLLQTTRNNNSPSQLTVGDGVGKQGELVERGVVQEPDMRPHISGWRDRLLDWITRVFCDLISDFTDDPEPVINRNTQDLTVKRSTEGKHFEIQGWNVNMVYLPSASPETPAKVGLSRSLSTVDC